MFLLSSTNSLFIDKLINVFNQTSHLFTTDQSKKYYQEIKFEIKNNRINIQIQNKIESMLYAPIRIPDIFNEITSLLKHLNISAGSLIYNPIQQRVSYNNLSIELGIIHNLIFSSFILNQNEGIEKRLLYLKIWPEDKNIFINKLDTHLTNLKNKFKKELDYDLSFKSLNGLIYLNVN